MLKITRALILASLAASLVAGCGGLPIEVCMNCFEHDAEKPLSEAQARSLTVDAPVRRLPVQARNVYFAEWCGANCTQIIRFDLPANIAHDEMSKYSVVEIGELSEQDQIGLLRAQKDGPPLSWWLREAIPNAEGVNTNLEIGQLTQFVMLPVGNTTRVYMKTFDM